MARNRHNIGFMAVDTIAIRYGFAPWRQRFKGMTAEGSVGGEKILALKPQTYMNESGASVQQAAAFYKLPPEVIQRLSELSKKALESDDLKAKFLDLAATAIWRSPADTLAYRDSEEARLAPIIKASGARVD